MTAREAADALTAAQTAMHRSHRAAVGTFARAPLVYWGIAWMAGYAAAQYLPGWLAYLVWLAFMIGSFVARRWWNRSRGGQSIVISGWEEQVRRAWWVIVLGSIALPLIVEPVPTVALYLLLGALWGIAYMLYAVVADDRALGLLGASIVALAVAVRLLVPEIALLLFGLFAGGSQMLFGIVRTRRQW